MKERHKELKKMCDSLLKENRVLTQKLWRCLEHIQETTKFLKKFSERLDKNV